jgi:VIT1/CCC1 family predicted Fe2+/Mn2+ transporter
MRASNIVALAMLFVAGWTLAQYAGGSRWRGGAAMVATGAFLVAVIMALGG